MESDMTHEHVEYTRRLVLSDDFTIYNAGVLKARLMAALDEVLALDIDIAQVAEIDTAGMQLLILAKREAARQGKELRIVAHSPTVLDAIDFLNLGAFFGDPLHIPATNANLS
jgi:anti-anti-sigma factor